MNSNITVGIDIGTYEVRVVISKYEKNNPIPVILGTGKSESKGLRHGYIINSEDVSRCVRLALDQAEKIAGVKVKKVFISIGGVGLSSINSQGSTIIQKADQEITDLDMEQAIKNAEEMIPGPFIQNRRIINSIPITWKIDSKPVLGRVLGMKGIKLETKSLFISCIESHLDDLIEAVENASVEVIDVVASPIAASFVTLTKSQKIAGCVLVNIGAETVSMVVFENNIPISLEVFPIGGEDITNDIALGLKISLEDAESLKLGSVVGLNYSKKKLEEIVSARIGDIFDLVDIHLKKIGKSRMLPAGIIMTGGSSALGMLEDLARSYLHLPSRIAITNPNNNKFQIKDSSWSVAYGLCIMGGLQEEDEVLGLRKKGFNIFKNILSIVKQFMP